MSIPRQPDMEFHISRQVRDDYEVDLSLFTLTGNVILADFLAARTLAQKMNARRDLVNFPERAVRASHLNAMGMIDEISHLVFRAYRQQRNPTALSEALEWFSDQLGEAAMDAVLRQFCDEFPPLRVYRDQESVDEYLAGDTEGVSNREILLEELILLWLANANPAFAPFRELFDDARLSQTTAYPQIISLLPDFFAKQPPMIGSEMDLIAFLRAPALASPDSLFGQLEFIRKNWSPVLGSYLLRILSGLDFIREEEKPIFGVGGPGPTPVFEYRGLEFEPEAFSPDLDWMPRLVLIAKNTYVWLDQLSKKYQQPIQRLDQIPTAELEQLARWGFTGLWLIGVWERSRASQLIKQLRGNPEAVASAYSLREYQIAQDLGGEEAFQVLRERAWRLGIRLASDMVPNHMGIDSRWVIEHPDWFISLDYSPFPTYTFNGPNLSQDDRVAIFIEDHYYDNTDAAVVFKRLDRYTGTEKYIYHGNDGTSMPWNDTAQLNYLLPEVREAVIQTILHVARQFPIIRFDAAMTLAKKHYQRLWFPEPGSGGDIPSRAEHGLTKEQFDALMPVEFWREVVDRVAQEVPDTLLLAEAFWLMEGYFVRTLGMHRVYNSAFMNMLRDEKNAEFRLTIKNTLEFDPEILKRYVNFMNNPDERTAVDQFGKGDKYFGICTMLATLPGLPMFGHGQIEGFTEKYGMEYRKAYWDEPVDQYLVERHERQIFPLLRRRRYFADVADFLLYDLYMADGNVNEDVFAYSNRFGDERSLVLYHNRFQTARGWIKTSAAFSVKTESGERKLVQKTLAEGLGLDYDENVFTIFRDHVSGLEYLRNNRELHERGLYVELNAYELRVYLNFRQVRDTEQRQYASLAAYLQGGGVPSIEEVILEQALEPLLAPARRLINPESLRLIIASRVLPDHPQDETIKTLIESIEEKLLAFLSALKRQVNADLEEKPIAYEILEKLTAALHLPVIETLYPDLKAASHRPMRAYLRRGPKPEAASERPSWLDAGDLEVWAPLTGWLLLHLTGKVAGEETYKQTSRTWLDELLLGKLATSALQGLSLPAVPRALLLIKILTTEHDWWKTALQQPSEAGLRSLLRQWFSQREVQQWTAVNRFEGVLWFNKEAFDELVWWLFLSAVIDIMVEEDQPPYQPESLEPGALPAETPEKAGRIAAFTAALYELVERIAALEEASGYQVNRLLRIEEAI